MLRQLPCLWPHPQGVIPAHWLWNAAAVTQSAPVEQGSTNLRRVLAPLALAQFIWSFAGSWAPC
jgi:hypothetical protein